MDLRRVGHPPQYVFSRIDELKAKVAARGVDVIDFARAHDMVVVCGRAYGDTTFDGYRAPSTLQVPGASDVAVELVSLSPPRREDQVGWELALPVHLRRGSSTRPEATPDLPGRTPACGSACTDRLSELAGELDAPPIALELVMDEARPVHRLEGDVDRLAVVGEALCETAQAVAVRRRGGDGDALALLIEQTDVHAFP